MKTAGQTGSGHFTHIILKMKNIEIMLKKTRSVLTQSLRHEAAERRSRKGLALTVGGSQLDHVRHFVVLGRMRSWRSGRRAERWRGHRLTTARFYFTPIEKRRQKKRAKTSRWSRRRRLHMSTDGAVSVGLQLGAQWCSRSDAGRLRGRARDGTEQRSSIEQMAHTAGT